MNFVVGAFVISILVLLFLRFAIVFAGALLIGATIVFIGFLFIVIIGGICGAIDFFRDLFRR